MALGIKVPVQVDALVVGRAASNAFTGPTSGAPFSDAPAPPAGSTSTGRCPTRSSRARPSTTAARPRASGSPPSPTSGS